MGSTAPRSDTRRNVILRFLQVFGLLNAVALLTLLLPGSMRVKAETERYYKNFPRFSRGEMRKRWAMVIDLRRCVGCYGCQVSCKMENGIPYEGFRMWVETYEYGKYPRVRRLFLPRMCNHCDNPPCVPVCPVKAIYKRGDGVVLIDSSKCIGCGYCVQACPYGAIYKNPDRGTSDKCTLCEHRLAQGLLPACATNCFGKAIYFGDLADPNSVVSKLIRENKVHVLKPEMGTDPMVFYIGLDEVLVTGAAGKIIAISPRTGIREVNSI